jgi:hypothetical protein
MRVDLMTDRARALRDRLNACPFGRAGWREFEDAAFETLCHLLVPPLARPLLQQSSLSGIDRRDAVFSNRVVDPSMPWGLLRNDYQAKLLLVEFKNYDLEEIGKEEVDQTRNYMRSHTGRLAIMVCSKPPSESARRRRNMVFSDEGKVILFLTKAHLREMLDMKDRGDDPSELILDLVDEFLWEHD